MDQAMVNYEAQTARRETTFRCLVPENLWKTTHKHHGETMKKLHDYL